MYANIEKKDCKVVTSYTHSAIHFGQFLSGVVGQLLLSFNVFGLDQINYLSLGGAVASFIFALFIPNVFRDYVSDALDSLERKESSTKGKEKVALSQNLEKVEAQNKETNNEKQPKEDAVKKPLGLDYRRNINKKISKLQKWKEAPILAKDNLVYAYSDWRVIKWSLWWVLAYALYIQVDLYIESLWKEIEHHSHQKVLNGAVHASHSVISKIIKRV